MYRGTSLEEFCMPGSRLYCVTDEYYVNNDYARVCSYYIRTVISVIELSSVGINFEKVSGFEEAGRNQ
jgi:hypothetical protein